MDPDGFIRGRLLYNMLGDPNASVTLNLNIKTFVASVQCHCHSRKPESQGVLTHAASFVNEKVSIRHMCLQMHDVGSRRITHIVSGNLVQNADGNQGWYAK